MTVKFKGNDWKDSLIDVKAMNEFIIERFMFYSSTNSDKVIIHIFFKLEHN